ncbi:type III pantothenate kinase [Ruminococcus sp.]|uniref:type III pantothenate kinase n=1 Tax=Ruminococcus sp. TaxID=41978 RepID=UPI002584F611|nr:type III pantothenate kinase [Ruminococcus sp.]MCR5021450.1 type III pantothenate kinase [Ruminococcus sp.]
MLLAIDVGNTNIVLGCIENDNILFRERIYTNQLATDLEYAANIKTAMEMHDIHPDKIDGAIISSVVPTITATFSAAVRKMIGVKPMVIGPGLKTGLSIVIDNPAQLGSDLVVDAVAGINEYPAPMIIIDMGTATTLSVIDEKKRYLGGMIVTGMAVSSEALISRTAQLPKFAFEKPKHVIGTNTVDCLKSGLMYSNAGAIDGMIERIEEELGQKCTVIATGGLAGTVVPLCRRDIILDDDLLLKGLNVIYNKNI